LTSFTFAQHVEQMQKQILHGVPYFTEKGILYTWDTTSPIPIGTYNGENITYKPEAIQTLNGFLTTWRTNQQSRERKPTTTNSRRNNANKATAVEDTEDNE